MYRLCGVTVLTYPLIFSSSEFYLSHDMALLMEDIRSELKFISQRWRLSGRPTFCIVVTENNMRFAMALNKHCVFTFSIACFHLLKLGL
jgi:phosphorylase kinase alpha/beta subunit